MPSEPTLGIDLGDPSCRMAWFDPASGRATPVPAGNDGPEMPSVVTRTGQGLVAGDEASRASEADPRAGLSYRTARAALGGTVRFALGDGEADPQGVAVALLRELKRRAEAHLGRGVTRVSLAPPPLTT